MAARVYHHPGQGLVVFAIIVGGFPGWQESNCIPCADIAKVRQ